MKKLRYTIILLFILQFANAQTEIKNLYSDLSLATNDNQKAELLVQISDYYYLRDNDSAKVYYNLAMDLYNSSANLKEQMYCLSKLSVIYNNTKRTDTALALVYRAIEIGEKYSYDTLLAESYLRLGNFYLEINKPEKAKLFYYKAIEINLPNTKNGAWGALGILFRTQNKLDSARLYLNRSLAYFRNLDTSEASNLYNISTLKGTLGIISFQEDKQTEGLYLLKESLRISRKLNNNKSTISCLLNLSIGYDFMSNPKKAEEMLMEALDLTDTLGYSRIKLNVYSLLSEHYMEYENYKYAFKYLELYQSLKDSLGEVNYQKTLHEKEIQYLSHIQEEELKRLAIEEEKTQIIFILTIAISGIIFTLITLFLFRKVKIRTTEKKKLKYQSEELSSNLEHATQKLLGFNQQLAERNKLIIELQLAIKNHALADVEDEVKELENRKILYNEDWEQYKEVFKSLHPNFLESMLLKHPNISEGDKRQLIMLKLKYSREKSADILGISPNSIKRARQRLSKKLGLTDVTALDYYIEEIVDSIEINE